MYKRHEFKFLFPNSVLEDIRKAVTPFVKPDPYYLKSGDEGYTVRSVYFDTIKLNNYYEKLEGIKIRKKLRIRSYNNNNNTQLTFLEIKRKYESSISKNRAPLKYANIESFLRSGNIEKYIHKSEKYPNASVDAEKFFYNVKKFAMRPLVLIVYEREAYFGNYNERLRITIDKNLRSAVYSNQTPLFSDKGLTHTIPGYSLLEVKFDETFPSWLKLILMSFSLERRPFSKYTSCLYDQNFENLKSTRIMFSAV